MGQPVDTGKEVQDRRHVEEIVRKIQEERQGSDREENEPRSREDEVTQELVKLWLLSVGQYVRDESIRREVPEEIISENLRVNSKVDNLLNRIPRLLTRNLITFQDLREEREREVRRQQILRRYEERLKQEEEERDVDRHRMPSN